MTEVSEHLRKVEEDIKVVKEAIKEASQAVVKDGVSNFPIFVAYKEYFPFGEKIVDNQDEELGLTYSFNVSTAEDFIKNGVIAMDKAKFFIASYKSVDTHFCLFVVNEKGDSNFVFVPY